MLTSEYRSLQRESRYNEPILIQRDTPPKPHADRRTRIQVLKTIEKKTDLEFNFQDHLLGGVSASGC